MDFKLHSDYKPTGDQPNAIRELSDGVDNGTPYQVLLGVTGSGKTPEGLCFSSRKRFKGGLC